MTLAKVGPLKNQGFVYCEILRFSKVISELNNNVIGIYYESAPYY